MRPTFVVVYKSGGDYTIDDVFKLKKNLDKHTTILYDFICLTDVTIISDEIITIPLISDYPGKWNMQEVFRMAGQVVVTGLDTVFVSNVDILFDIAKKTKENQFWMIKSFNKYREYANGIMIWNGDWQHLLFNYDTHLAIQEYTLEQEFTIWKLRQEKVKIKVLNNKIAGIYSYKKNIQGHEKLPIDAKIIIFHGNPRPSKIQDKWIKKMY